jgi:hypothetical protein
VYEDRQHQGLGNDDSDGKIGNEGNGNTDGGTNRNPSPVERAQSPVPRATMNSTVTSGAASAIVEDLMCAVCEKYRK